MDGGGEAASLSKSSCSLWGDALATRCVKEERKMRWDCPTGDGEKSAIQWFGHTKAAARVHLCQKNGASKSELDGATLNVRFW